MTARDPGPEPRPLIFRPIRAAGGLTGFALLAVVLLGIPAVQLACYVVVELAALLEP